MYKLKNQYIDKMIENQLSSKEIDFLLYIARFQSESGTVYSVYYKDICTAINISTQKFYDILSSLESKRLILARKENKIDYCITLVGNDFSDKDFSKGYLNVAHQSFQKAEFASLKAGAKLLYLYMQRFTEGRHMLLTTFYDEFCERFHCVKKTIQEYLRQLKDLYYVISKRKRNRSYNYEMCLKNGTTLHVKAAEKYSVGTENDLYQINIQKMLSNNFKAYLPESPDKTLRDIAQLVITRVNPREYIKDFPLLIVNAVKDSLQIQTEEGKEEPKLNAALVNKCLSGLLKIKQSKYSYA